MRLFDSISARLELRQDCNGLEACEVLSRGLGGGGGSGIFFGGVCAARDSKFGPFFFF